MLDRVMRTAAPGPVTGFAPDGRAAILIAEHGKEHVSVLKSADGAQLTRFEVPPGSVHGLAFGASGRLLIAGEGLRGNLSDTVSAGATVIHAAAGGRLLVSRDGATAAVAERDAVSFWDVRTGKKTGELFVSAVDGFVGSKHVARHVGDAIEVFRVPAGRRVAELLFPRGHEPSAVVSDAEGHVDLLGMEHTESLECRIGRYTFPLDICEDRARVRGLLQRVVEDTHGE